MLSNILSNVAFSSTSLSMVGLLINATLILIVAIGVTLSMQRASAGARHLVAVDEIVPVLEQVPVTGAQALERGAVQVEADRLRGDRGVLRQEQTFPEGDQEIQDDTIAQRTTS